MTHKITMGKNTLIPEINPGDLLKRLSTQDFLSLGLRDIAYVRPISTDLGEQYAIHAADGTPLSVMDSAALAVTAIRNNDLEPATVH